jgi:hypothetical protein
MVNWGLSDLHMLVPEDAAKLTTFTIAKDNSSTVYRVGGSADESPGRLRLCTALCVVLRAGVPVCQRATLDYSSG